MNATTTPGRIFVVDPDNGARRALERLMASASWQVEGFGSAAEFLDRLPYDGVGCALLEVEMPDMSGPDLQQRMLESGVSLPILYLTGDADVPMVVHVMKKGALDVLQKPAQDAHVLSAVAAAVERHRAVTAANRKRLEAERRIARLTPREREVLEGVIGGCLNKQIAADLGVAEKTVKEYRSRLTKKLETRSVPALVRLCVAAGIEARPHPHIAGESDRRRHS